MKVWTTRIHRGDVKSACTKDVLYLPCILGTIDGRNQSGRPQSAIILVVRFNGAPSSGTVDLMQSAGKLRRL